VEATGGEQPSSLTTSREWDTMLFGEMGQVCRTAAA
jgi:hypothetical protein